MVVTLGEVVIDIKNGVCHVGGGPVNTAVACSRLGTLTSFIGGISSDKYGKTVMDYLNDNGVLFDPAFCNDSLPTMTAEVKTENGNPVYEFKAKGTCAFNIDYEKTQLVLAANSDIRCLFTGSVSFTDPAVRHEINKIADNTDFAIFFDPNVRTSFIEDFDSYQKDVFDFAGKSDIVKLSTEDLCALQTDVKSLLENCRSHLIVTDGPSGSTWYQKGRKPISVPAIPCQNISDTIGCGDSVSGAVLHCFHEMNLYGRCEIEDETKRKILQFANLCASINCTKEGCNPPYEKEVSY